MGRYMQELSDVFLDALFRCPRIVLLRDLI